MKSETVNHRKTDSEDIEAVTEDNVEAILRFLPIFDQEGYVFGEVIAEKGQFPFDQLEKFYVFSDINKAIGDSRRGDTIKPVLRISKA